MCFDPQTIHWALVFCSCYCLWIWSSISERKRKSSFDSSPGPGQVVSLLWFCLHPLVALCLLRLWACFAFALLVDLLVWCALFILVQLDDFEIQQHYDEFFEEVYVEMEKVRINIPPRVFSTPFSFLFVFNSKLLKNVCGRPPWVLRVQLGCDSRKSLDNYVSHKKSTSQSC